jgi:hypothetical protein
MNTMTRGTSTIVGMCILGAALFTSGQAKAYTNASETIVTPSDYYSSCGSGSCYQKTDCAGTSSSCNVSYYLDLFSAAGGGAYLYVTGVQNITNYWFYIQVYCSSSGWQSAGWFGPNQYAGQGNFIGCPGGETVSEAIGWVEYN